VGLRLLDAIPAVFRLLAERSLTPSERVGDAQAVMAVGRVVGPVVGGIALGTGHFTLLSIVGAVIMCLAAFTVTTVEVLRRRT
jgi:predicted MFS family arabinose efflux permease